MKNTRLAKVGDAASSSTPSTSSSLERIHAGTWMILAASLPVVRSTPLFSLWTLFVFMVIIFLAITGHIRRPFSGALWLWAAGFVLVAVVSIWNPTGDINAHLETAAQLVVLFGLAPFVLRSVMASFPLVLPRCVSVFLVVQTISGFVAIAQAAGLTVFGIASLYGRSPGLAGHQNVLGVFCGMAILICIHRLIKSDKYRAVVASFLLINAAALLVSGSWSSLLSFSFGIAVYLIASRGRLLYIIPSLILAGIFMWIANTAGGSDSFRSPLARLEQVTGQTDQRSTLFERFQTVEYAWNQIQVSPFYGVGMGNLDGGTFDGITVVHNIMVRAWYQGGFALFVAFCIVIAILVAAIIQSTVRAQSPLGAGVLTVWIAFAMTAAVFQQPLYWIPILTAFTSCTLKSQQLAMAQR